MLTAWLSRIRPRFLAGAGSLLLLLALASTVGAAPLAGVGRVANPSSHPPLAWAEGSSFSLRSYFSGLGARSRVIHLCIVVMCIALFILMKKFHDSDSVDRMNDSAKS